MLSLLIKCYLFIQVIIFIAGKFFRILRGGLFIISQIKKNENIYGLNKFKITDLWLLSYEFIFLISIICFYSFRNSSPDRFALEIFIIFIIPDTILNIIYFYSFLRIKILSFISVISLIAGFAYISQ